MTPSYLHDDISYLLYRVETSLLGDCNLVATRYSYVAIAIAIATLSSQSQVIRLLIRQARLLANFRGFNNLENNVQTHKLI